MFLTCTYTAVYTQIDVYIMYTAVCEIKQQKASTKTDVTVHRTEQSTEVLQCMVSEMHFFHYNLSGVN